MVESTVSECLTRVRLMRDLLFNDLVVMAAGLRKVTSIVLERQLRIYGHVARVPAGHSAHQNLSFRDAGGLYHTEGAARVLHCCVRWSRT